MTLAELLKNLGFTSYQIAKESGVPYPTLHRYLNGQNDIEKMSVSHASKIAKACGITIDEMMQNLTGDDDLFTIMADADLEEGWNSLTDSLDVYVDDGKIGRGTVRDEIVYPFKKDEEGGFNRIDEMTVEEFHCLAEDRNLFWK